LREPPERKASKTLWTGNDKDIEKVVAMVSFYSARAEAHASFFLASFFGLFVVLSLAQTHPIHQWISMWGIPYWLLFLGSLYVFANFSLYATYAQKIAERAHLYEVQEVKRGHVDAGKNLILNWFQISKGAFRAWRFGIIGIVYVAVAFLSCWLVIGSVEAVIGLISVSLVIAVSWIWALYRWGSSDGAHTT